FPSAPPDASRADDIGVRQTAISATGSVDRELLPRIEHRLDIALRIEVEIGSVQHKPHVGDLLIRVRKVQCMDRAGGLIEKRAGSVDLGIFKIFPRACQGEGKDVARMFVSLDGPAGLAPNANHEEARFDVDLDELEGDAFLIRHTWQVAFSATR